MKAYETLGVTQRIMADLTGLSLSTINRYIASHRLEPANTHMQRNLRYSVRDSRNIISDLYTNRLKVQKKIQSFYNFKGGTGKTSICYQVSSHLALMGFKVLVIDADPQGHISTSFGFNHEDSLFTLYDVVVEDKPLEFVIKQVYEGLDCIPANLSLTRVEVHLNQMPKREERVGISLEEIKDKYDFIMFDTNPTISHLNRNIITCSEILNIVCETQPYSLNGLKLLLEDLRSFYKSMRMKEAEIFIIPNKYEDRTSSSAEAMTALREFYSTYMKPDFAVRKSEDINTSAKISLPLSFFCKVNSIALSDIIELIKYILQHSTLEAVPHR